MLYSTFLLYHAMIMSLLSNYSGLTCLMEINMSTMELLTPCQVTLKTRIRWHQHQSQQGDPGVYIKLRKRPRLIEHKHTFDSCTLTVRRPDLSRRRCMLTYQGTHPVSGQGILSFFRGCSYFNHLRRLNIYVDLVMYQISRSMYQRA